MLGRAPNRSTPKCWSIRSGSQVIIKLKSLWVQKVITSNNGEIEDEGLN